MPDGASIMALNDRFSFANKYLIALQIMFTSILLGASCHSSRGEQSVRFIPLEPNDARILVIRWWRWRVALPELAAPNRDRLGRFCNEGQVQDTWFLGGFLAVGERSAETHRTCTLPANTKLFFPIVTTAKFVHGTVDCAKAKNEAAAVINDVENLYAKIDGTALSGLSNRRYSSGSCEIIGPIKSRLATSPAAIDGYWLALNPLSSGHHLLEYGVDYKANSPESGQYKNTIYELEVQ